MLLVLNICSIIFMGMLFHYAKGSGPQTDIHLASSFPNKQGRKQNIHHCDANYSFNDYFRMQIGSCFIFAC